MKLSCVIISADTMQCLDWPTQYYRIWISRYYKTIMCDYIGQCNPIVNTVWANPIDWYRSIKYNWIWTNRPTWSLGMGPYVLIAIFVAIGRDPLARCYRAFVHVGAYSVIVDYD